MATTNQPPARKPFLLKPGPNETAAEFSARVKSYLAAEVPPDPRGSAPQQRKMNSG